MTSSIVPVSEIDTQELHIFLSRFYPRAKCDFLRAHGDWWHGGSQNRWVLLVEDRTHGERSRTIAGYCAVIPTQVLFHTEILPAIWWVDLVIAPEFRGLGLQSLFDEKIRQMDGLKLGIPNPLAAKIHTKHGWGVRDDLQVQLLPLIPLAVNQVRITTGLRGWFLRLSASILTPFSGIIRRWLSCYQPQTAHPLVDPSPEILSGVFSRFKPTDLSTTVRDAIYFRRRFLDAPYRDELSFYVAGAEAMPTHYLITRHLKRDGLLVTRILDIFGDFSDEKGLKDIILLALRDAVLKDSSQVTILTTLPQLKTFFFRLGFFLKSQGHFCWLSPSQHLMSLPWGQIHWTLADSDNDAPD